MRLVEHRVARADILQKDAPAMNDPSTIPYVINDRAHVLWFAERQRKYRNLTIDYVRWSVYNATEDYYIFLTGGAVKMPLDIMIEIGIMAGETNDQLST